jgi:RNA polymerase sigma-70 factor (ECF subfamily)
MGRDVPLEGARTPPPLPTDESREREARFTELYREHYPFVLRFALRRLRALDLAQDATVATFAVIWSRFDDVPELPRAWIYRVARSVVSLELRQRMRDERAPGHRGRLRLTEHDLADDPVLRALSELHDDDREVLQLRAWEELSGEEIGEVLGWNPSDAALRLHEAQLRLKELLASTTRATEDEARARRSVPRRAAAVPNDHGRRGGSVSRRVPR